MIYVVLGMHKSGTTLIAQTLHKSGINMGNFDLNQTYDKGNKYERLETQNINKRLLNCGNAHSLDVIQPISENEYYDKKLIQNAQTMIDYLNSNYNDWGFKDPRTCLTYKFWKKILPEHKLIIVYRHPVEVEKHYVKTISAKYTQHDINKLRYKIHCTWLMYNMQLIKIIGREKKPSLLINYSKYFEDNKDIMCLQKYAGRFLVDTRDFNLYRHKQNNDPEYNVKSMHQAIKIDNIYSRLEKIRLSQNIDEKNNISYHISKNSEVKKITINWIIGGQSSKGWAYENNANRLSSRLEEYEHLFQAQKFAECAIFFDAILYDAHKNRFRSYKNILRLSGPRPLKMLYGNDTEKLISELSGFDAIIALNNDLARIAYQANENVYLIPNGIDLTTWKPRNEIKHVENKKFVVGFAGSVLDQKQIRIKGYDLVVEACKKAGVELFAVKKKENQIPHDQMAENFYHKIDCLLHPVAEGKEGSSNVIMEALACGVPVITTRHSGYHAEYMNHGENILFCERDVQDICDNIDQLQNNELLRNTISVNGRKFAEKHHDIENIAEKYREAIYSAIKKSNAPATDDHSANRLFHTALGAMDQSDWAKAVRLWQELVIELGDKTPKKVYSYLDHSYKELKSFPKGKDEEEVTVGDAEKHDFLAFVHENLRPDLYLEIGIQKGKGLKLAKCPAIGIDPMPQINTDLPEHAQVIAMTSDDFFQNNPSKYIKQPPDLVFIDGMHLFEFVLRDFINVERLSAKYSVIVVDDIFPGHPAQAERTRKTRNWTGDVWKLYAVLQKYRPDLTLIPVNVSPTGILIITNLDPKNNMLSDKYNDIVKKYSVDIEPPEDIIERKGSLPSFSKSLATIVKKIRGSREDDKNRTVTTEILKFNAQNSVCLSANNVHEIKEKVAVYTAITGCCDKLADPEYMTPEVDYICFTDNPHLRSDVWDIRLLPSSDLDNIRKAKLPKILPHRLLPDHQVSLWIDGNICLKNDLRPLVSSSLNKLNMALFRHPENRESVESELQSCVRLNKDNPEILNKQMHHYKTSGMPINQPPPTCMVIFRRHNHPEIKFVMEAWWNEIMTHSFRDQISFPYIAWKHDLKYKVIHDNVRDNKYFTWYKHDIKISKEKMQKEYEQSDAVFLSSPGSGLDELSDMLNSHHYNQHLNFSFTHNYYDLYPDCPGDPEVLYPELLSCKPLVVLHRDPQKSNRSYFKEKSKQANLHFASFKEFSSSDIYGIKRHTNYTNVLMEFYNNHPGPKLFLEHEELASSPSEVIQSINSFISNINRTNHMDINLTCQKNDYSQNQKTDSESVPEKMELLVEVENAMNQKAWERAISLCQDLFARYKDQVPPEAYVLYSMSHRFQGNPSQAEAVMTQGVKKFPEDIKIHVEYAQVAKARGNLKQAEKHLKISEMLSSAQAKDNNPIVIIDTDKIDSFRYSDPEGVAVIMPCIDTQQGLKTADILQRRAGMPCKIVVANDTLRQGFIKTANEVFKRLDVKYVVYLAQDAFPGRDWLILAYQTLEKTGKSLLAFNDGKWMGKYATFGMVRSEWVKGLYGNNIFYHEYFTHSADIELSAIAKKTNNYIYNPDSTLIEVDYKKDLNQVGNPQDKSIFIKRRNSGFNLLNKIR